MPPKVSARLAIALAAASLCLGAKVSRILPPPPQGALKVEGARVSLPLGGLEVSLTLLDAAQRAVFLSERAAGGGTDPFRSEPGGRYRFTTFRLDLVNRTPHEVNLHPASVRAVADDIPYFPLEYTAAYEHFVSERRLDPALLDSLLAATFVETIVVPAGGRATGLLVFRDLPERFKRFAILGGNVLVGSEGRSFLIPFAVVQEKLRKPKRERGKVSVGVEVISPEARGEEAWR